MDPLSAVGISEPSLLLGQTMGFTLWLFLSVIASVVYWLIKSRRKADALHEQMRSLEQEVRTLNDQLQYLEKQKRD